MARRSIHRLVNSVGLQRRHRLRAFSKLSWRLATGQGEVTQRLLRSELRSTMSRLFWPPSRTKRSTNWKNFPSKPSPLTETFPPKRSLTRFRKHQREPPSMDRLARSLGHRPKQTDRELMTSRSLPLTQKAQATVSLSNSSSTKSILTLSLLQFRIKLLSKTRCLNLPRLRPMRTHQPTH